MGRPLVDRLPTPLYLCAGALASLLVVLRGAQAVLSSGRRRSR